MTLDEPPTVYVVPMEAGLVLPVSVPAWSGGAIPPFEAVLINNPVRVGIVVAVMQTPM